MTNEDIYDKQMTIGQCNALSAARAEMDEWGVLSLDTQINLSAVGIDADSDPFAPTFIGDN